MDDPIQKFLPLTDIVSIFLDFRHDKNYVEWQPTFCLLIEASLSEIRIQNLFATMMTLPESRCNLWNWAQCETEK